MGILDKLKLALKGRDVMQETQRAVAAEGGYKVSKTLAAGAKGAFMGAASVGLYAAAPVVFAALADPVLVDAWLSEIQDPKLRMAIVGLLVFAGKSADNWWKNRKK